MKKLNLIMIITILLIGIAIAEQQSLGIFRLNDCVELIQTCSNCTWVNFTSVKYPNSSIGLGNVNASRLGTEYTYKYCNTSILGEYIVNGVGDVDGVYTVFAYDFDVTQTGSELSTSGGIVYIIFIISIMLVFALMLYGAVKIKWRSPRDNEGKIVSINDLKYLKIFLWVMSYIVLMWIFALLRQITADFLYLNSASLFFEWAYWIMLSFLWPGIVVALLAVVVNFLTDKKLKRKLMRGIPIR